MIWNIKLFHKIPMLRFFQIIYERIFLKPSISLPMRQAFCGFSVHRDLERYGIHNIVVNPSDIPTTDKEKRQKEDKRDSRKIAKSLKNGELTAIYVPTKEMEELRSLARCSSPESGPSGSTAPQRSRGAFPSSRHRSSTWDDADGDGRITGSETFEAAVVCAREGNLTVLGDPSLFINAMLTENPQFIQNTWPVRIDGIHSRTGTANQIINTRLWIQETPLAVAALAALAVLPVAYRFGRKENE